MRAAALGLLAAFFAGACGSHPKGIAPDVKIPILLQAPQSSLPSLRDHDGHAVVLEFWATWCGPCVEGIPAMNKMVEAFKGRRVRFISVTNEPRETVEAFLKKHEMKAWIGIDTEGAAERAFGVHGIPAIFVIDRYGRIWHNVQPSFFYRSDVEDAINAKPPLELASRSDASSPLQAH